jgi:hypothetical protein
MSVIYSKKERLFTEGFGFAIEATFILSLSRRAQYKKPKFSPL